MLFVVEDEDYAAISETATFDPSSVFSNSSTVEVCIDIIITDDSIGEPEEQFSVVVEPSDPSQRITVVNGRIPVIIRDNESKLNCTKTKFYVVFCMGPENCTSSNM